MYRTKTTGSHPYNIGDLIEWIGPITRLPYICRIEKITERFNRYKNDSKYYEYNCIVTEIINPSGLTHAVGTLNEKVIVYSNEFNFRVIELTSYITPLSKFINDIYIKETSR